MKWNNLSDSTLYLRTSRLAFGKTTCISSNCSVLTSLLLKVLVVFNVLCSAHQNKSDVVTAVIARRKCFPVDAGHFMLSSVIRVVNDPVDPGPLYSLTWFVFFGHCLIPPENPHRSCGASAASFGKGSTFVRSS